MPANNSKYRVLLNKYSQKLKVCMRQNVEVIMQMLRRANVIEVALLAWGHYNAMLGMACSIHQHKKKVVFGV